MLLMLLLLFVGAGTVVALSILILRRGRLYHRIKPESRPRRWVLMSLLLVFAIFVIWFPIWFLWPDALISRILGLLFVVIFFAVGLALRWLVGLVDWFVKRKGWALR